MMSSRSIWCLLGYPEEAYYERKAEAEYDFLWLEKYDCDRSILPQ